MMIRIETIAADPIAELQYLNARSGGGSEVSRLEILREGKQHGNEAIRAVIDAGEVPLTVCGHCQWKKPLAEHARGQILNVDARVVVLTPRC